MQFTDEKRRTPRRSVITRARIVYDRGNATIECIVRNQSSRGARLELPSATRLPDTFFLVLADTTQTCRVAWRRPEEVGVRYQTR